jgi:hypothetical protein
MYVCACIYTHTCICIHINRYIYKNDHEYIVLIRVYILVSIMCSPGSVTLQQWVMTVDPHAGHLAFRQSVIFKKSTSHIKILGTTLQNLSPGGLGTWDLYMPDVISIKSYTGTYRLQILTQLSPDCPKIRQSNNNVGFTIMHKV